MTSQAVCVLGKKVPGVEDAPVEPLERPGVSLVPPGIRPEQPSIVSLGCQVLDPDRGTNNGRRVILNTCNPTDSVVTSNPLQALIPVQLAPPNDCEAETIVPDVAPTIHESSTPRQAPASMAPRDKMDKLLSALSSAALLSAAWLTDDTTVPAGASARLAQVFAEVRTENVTSQLPTGNPVLSSALHGVPKQGAANKRPAVRDQTAATKSSGAPRSGAHHVAKTAPGANALPGVNRKTNAKDASVPVASGDTASNVNTKCGAKTRPRPRYRKLLKCVDHESGIHVEHCPDHIAAAALAKKARITAGPAVTQKAPSPKKKKRAQSSLKKTQRSKLTQTESSPGQGSVSLFLSITNGTVASTQVNHRRQAEKGCVTARTSDRTLDTANIQLTTTPPPFPVPVCLSDSTTNSSCQQRPQDPQLEASPSKCLPGLSDNQVVRQELMEHVNSGGESATTLLVVPKQEPSSLRQPEVEDVSFWDATKVTQEVMECKNDDSAELRVVPREVSNEELILPDIPDPVDLFNGTRIKEEVADCEDNFTNQERLVPGESEPASLLGANWIKQELMDGDDCVEHCIGSPGSKRPEEPRIKQEPMECDDSSAGEGSVGPLVVPKTEQPELMADSGYLLGGCVADGVCIPQ